MKKEQLESLLMRAKDGEDPQLAYCSDRFKQGLEDSLERRGETKSQSGGSNYNQAKQERGHNKRKNKCRLPEELVITELTDAIPVKKEIYVVRAQADRSSCSHHPPSPRARFCPRPPPPLLPLALATAREASSRLRESKETVSCAG